MTTTTSPPPPPARRRGACRRSAADRGELGRVQLERSGARRGARGLGAAGTWYRQHDRREREQPPERSLRGTHAAPCGQLGKPGQASEPAGAARTSERRVGDQRDPPLGAALHHSPTQGALVLDAERDLHRRHGRELERLVELVAAHVREPDAPHEPLVHQPRECAHRRTPRRARVGGVDQVDVDRQAVERGEARLAVREDRLGAPIGHPAAPLPRHAALRDDARGRVRAAGAQGTREQPLVVTELGRPCP